MNKFILISFLIISSYAKANESYEDIFIIDSKLNIIENSLNEKLYIIKSQSGKNIEKIWHGYNFIKGFNYELGYKYKIKVKITPKDFMTMNYPNTKNEYKLIEVIEKNKDKENHSQTPYIQDVFVIHGLKTDDNMHETFIIESQNDNDIEEIAYGYNFIKGFKYEIGYKYKIKVKYKEKEFYTAIYPNTKNEYQFIEIIEKQPTPPWKETPKKWQEYNSIWKKYLLTNAKKTDNTSSNRIILVKNKNTKKIHIFDFYKKIWLETP